MPIHRIGVLAAAVLLGACQSAEQAAIPPVANAGVGQVVLVGTEVTLDGSSSRTADGASEGLVFSWSLVSTPAASANALDGADTVNPTLVVDAPGDFVIRLVVREGSLESVPAVTRVLAYQPLEVIGTTPASGAWGVAPTSPVVVEFNEALQPETATPESLFLLEGQTVIPGTLELEAGNSLAIYSPSEPFRAGQQLTVVVTQQVVSVSGQTLPAVYHGHFHVAAGADTLSPEISSTSPEDGATDVARGAPVIVVFDEQVVAESVLNDTDRNGCPDNFRVLDTVDCIPGTVEMLGGDTRVMFLPDDPWVAGANYSVVIYGDAGGVRDPAGNEMQGYINISFTVATESDNTPPVVVAAYPGPGFEDVPLGAQVVVTFSETMEPSTVTTDNLSLSDGILDLPVALEGSFGHRVVTLRPARQLEPSTLYTLTLRGDGLSPLADIEGNALDGDQDGELGGDYVTSFTTTGDQTFDGELTVPATVEPGETITVVLNDRDLDATVAADTIVVDVTVSTGELEVVILTETGPTTGEFQGTLGTTPGTGPGTNDDGIVVVGAGDSTTFFYDDEASAGGVPRVVSATVGVVESQAAITVSPVSADTTEAGGTATFAVVLNLAPSANVSIYFDSSDPSEGTVSTTELIFTPNNWNAPQIVIVTGEDDELVDGDQTFEVAFTPTVSSDGNYNAITPAPVTVVNVDDESAGFAVSAISGPTTEAGGTASFTLRLNSQPSADVQVHFDSDNPTEGTVAVRQLTFTSQNWNAPQTVVVTGADDLVADGNQSYQIAFAATTSSDSDYAAIRPPDVTVINIDNESAGFLVSPISGPTTEGGGTAQFAVVLASQPRADVTVSFSSDDSGEGVCGVSSLRFTSDNWAAPQFVMVTGVDDDVADGNQPYVIVFGSTNSTDSGYGSIRPSNVQVINIDNDSAGITVGDISGDTTEAGGQASFTVVLNSQPTASVTLALASLDIGEGTVSPTSLTFTEQNWSGIRTVLVTGVNDDMADGNQVYDIEFSQAESDDTGYAGLRPGNVAVTNVDNDSAGITVTPLVEESTEAGGQASFEVVLNSQPTADVVVSFESSDTSEGLPTTISVTFTDLNWSAPQTVLVTGADDAVADGNWPYAISLTVRSADGNYEGFSVANVDLSNIDDDSAGITVTPGVGESTEAGGQASFTVVLNSQPTASVVIDMTSSVPAEGSFGGEATHSITFTALNWDAPQTVLVNGEDDDVQDGERPYAISFAVTSADGNYEGFSVANVDLTNIDDDSAGITVTPLVEESTEAGGQASFTVVLNSQPTASVDIGMTSSVPAEGSFGGEATHSITFTDLNWDAPQTVLVNGEDDDVQDGNRPYAISLTVTSVDGNYEGFAVANVDLTNIDDDSAGITVTPGVEDSTEAGGQASFTVVLNSQPESNVTVSFSTSDPAEGLLPGGLETGSVGFTDLNWDAPQTVLVTGVDDAIQDGDQTYAIVFNSTASADANYAGRTPANVDLRNLDDDSAGITVTTGVTDSTEAGGAVTFDVVLDSQPTDQVDIEMTSSEPDEGLIGGLVFDTISFTDADWDTAQTVTVTGIDDAIQDGDQPYAISFDVTSGDSNYEGYSLANVDLTNLDDDSAGISVTVNDSVSTEAGDTASFDVVLDSQPTHQVDIRVTSSEPTEGLIGGLVFDTISFTDADWDTAQTVTVTGIDDDLEDGNRPYAISFAVTSGDSNYEGYSVANVDLTNEDDDIAGVSVSVTDATTDETGGTATLSVVLTSQPAELVNISCESADPGEGTVTSGGTPQFSDGNWDTAQTVTVTGVDDSIDDGDFSYDINCTASSADANYDGELVTRTLVNQDDDVAAVVVSTAAGDTGEDGTTTTFTVELGSDPNATVAVSCSSGTPAEGQVTAGSPASFDSTDWNVPVTITVTGQDDEVNDGNQSYGVTCTADAAYGGLSDTVSITNLDDDVAAVVVSAAAGDTGEDGTTTTFTVALATQPTASVSVSCVSDDSTEGQVTGGSPATFSTTDYGTGQTITVTGLDDASSDGDIAYTVTCTADAAYGGLSDTVSITNLDDDVAAVVVSAAAGDTGENGTTTTFTVALATQPTASVSVSCVSDDSTEGQVTGGSPATFSTTDYGTGQTITVTGLDDTSIDGDIAYTVTCTADAVYGNLSDSVSITNLDTGVDATVEILQSSFSLGTGITIRVVGDIDEYAASGSVTVVVVTETAGDSETVTLVEDTGIAGDFDCTVDGCIIPTAVATPTPSNGVLEAPTADTVGVYYTDIRRADNNSGMVQDTASANAANCAVLVINEIVTDPQADWSDSVGGGTPFDATAGTDTPATDDEWVEIYNAGTCAVDLTASGGYDLQMLGTGATYNFASPPGGSALYFPGTSTATNFINGEYLVIGNPTGSGDLLDNGWLRIDEPGSGGIMDEVAFGTSVGGDGSNANNAPAGTATDASTESIERLPDLTDTDVDNSDWAQTSNNSTIAAANN